MYVLQSILSMYKLDSFSTVIPLTTLSATGLSELPNYLLYKINTTCAYLRISNFLAVTVKFSLINH